MKIFTQVNRSQGMIRTLVGLRSRITSTKPLLTMLALLMVALFGVNEKAWGAWPTYSGTITQSGSTYYVLNDGTDRSISAAGRGESYTYNLGGPGANLSCYAARSKWEAIGDLKITTYKDGTKLTEEYSGNPSGNYYWGFFDSYKDVVTKNGINVNANKLRFSASGGSYSKKFKDVKVTMFSGVMQPLFLPSNSAAKSWTYTAADYAAEDSHKDFTVDWSNLASLPLSKAVNGSSDDRSQFSYEILSNTQTLGGGKYGTATVRVYYKHDKVGTHSVKVNVGSYSITFTGTTNKITPYIDTKPTVDPITYGQTISNSQLQGGVVKANLINAAGTVVQGTWTIDENGQTVTASGSANTTVHLTFTPTDQNTYNVIQTTQTMYVRSVSTISWANAYSAEKPTIPIGKTIENAATTNAAGGATITYTTSDPDIIEIGEGGTTFKAISEGEATITASHDVTATHGSASVSKTFKTTYKDIQVIVWNDRFDRLTTEMKSKDLVAEVWIEDPSTGERTYNNTRTALLEYSVGDNTVVSIPANSTKLTIHKKGETTITATVKGDDQYESASITMPVKVREPSAGCDDPLLLDRKNDGTNDYLYRLFSMSTDKPALYTEAYAINVAQGQVPDKLSFSFKGELYSPNLLKRLKGKVKAQERIGNSDSGWQDIESSKYIDLSKDDAAKWYDLEDIPVSEGATAIRFYRPQGGEGYHYVRNVEVTMKHFIRSTEENPVVDFGNTIKVNSSEFQDVVINYSNAKGSLQVINPFAKDVTVSDDYIDIDDCGAFGSATLRIFFSPTTVTETIDDYIVVKDPVVGNSSALYIRVKADVQRADQTIEWNPETNISTIDQILLNGITNGQEHGQMNTITYTVTNNDGVISVTDNVVTILKPGTVTITASQSGSTNYAAATSVEKNFTISAEPLTLVAPTAQDITYGQALSESELTGGSAKDSKNNTVYGTFAWQTGSTKPNANDEAQGFTVVFTPSTNAAWYTDLTTTATVNVAKAIPSVTPQASAINYGQAISKSELSTASGEVAGTWSWAVDATQVLNAGVHNLTANFTSNNANYNNLSNVAVTLTVNKANPSVTPQASAITYGQPISASSLTTKTGNVDGSWSWAVDATQVLSVGNHDLKANFSSNDANYNNLSNVDITLIVNKIETLNVDIPLSFCPGSSETFHGRTYTEAGSDVIEATGATRDTVYNVTVTILQPTTGTDSKTITVGAEESWNEIDLSGYAVGEYEIPFHTMNAVGCDSTVTLNLTVNKIETLPVPVALSFCAGGSEEYRGTTYTKAGTYPVYAEGATRDTVYTVTVTVLQPTTGTDSKIITYGDAESWHGTDLSNYTVGDHEVFFHTENVAGCDSTVTLNLTVNKANPTLAWSVAPTNLAYNGTATYTATSASNGAITYAIVEGGSYASIDENTGVLSIIEPGYTVTVQASQAEAANYNAPEAITVDVVIAAAPVNEFTNANGDGDWTNPANWSGNAVPEEDTPIVIVSGELVISDTLTVSDLTIEKDGGVTIVDDGKLIVTGESKDRVEYGDIHVMDDGELELKSTARLEVRHFTLDAKLGNTTNAAASGQISNEEKLNVNGDVYFQMTFEPNGAVTYGWYDFVVPFEVDIVGGIYEPSNLTTPLTNGWDYAVMAYDESKRAVKGKDWNKFSGTMLPGRVYTITIDYTRGWKSLVFKKKAGAAIGGSDAYQAEYSSTLGESLDRGWNGLGNGTLRHTKLAAENVIIQIYDHANKCYVPREADSVNLAVGTSFFMQVGSAQTIVMNDAASNRPLLAPSVNGRHRVENFRLALVADGADYADDRTWLSASEEATGEYVVGRDVLKMGSLTGTNIARLWTRRADMNLCSNQMLMNNDESNCELGLYAPKAQAYTLSIENGPEDADLYLTYEDRIIWDLTAIPYTFDLNQGTTTGYGLRMKARAPQVATGVDEQNAEGQAMRKVIIDNTVYVITPDGKMYDIVGKSIK